MPRIYATGVIAVVIAALGASGCSRISRGFDRVFPDRRTEYQKSETLPDLEIPPELSNSRIQERMAIPPANATPNATFRERAAARGATPTTAPATAAAPAATAPARTAPTASAPADNARVQLVSSGAGKVYIVLREQLETAWQSVGEALDAAGIKIDDDKPKRGFYKVRVVDPGQTKGMLSKLAFWRSNGTPYRVSVTAASNGTEIVILDDDGEWDTSAEAGQLLAAIFRQLNTATSR